MTCIIYAEDGAERISDQERIRKHHQENAHKVHKEESVDSNPEKKRERSDTEEGGPAIRVENEEGEETSNPYFTDSTDASPPQKKPDRTSTRLFYEYTV